MKSILIVLLFSGSAAFAAGVSACLEDSYSTERINEDVPKNERLDVLNAQGQVVGAFHYFPQSGELIALYLCGPNSGYYYAKGNINEGKISSLYNDEYDSAFEVYEDNGILELSVHAIYFTSDPRYAGYGPFSAVLFVKKP